MRVSLRVKLLLVSLLLLIIPLLGFRLNSSLKTSLIASQEDALSLTATAVSTALGNRSELFAQEGFQSLQQGRDLYLFQLSNPIKLNDGGIDDWLPDLSKAQTFGREHLLIENRYFNPESLSFRYLAGIQGEFLYALFDVVDDHLVYQGSNLLDFEKSDHLKIVIERDGVQRTYILAPQKPGLVIGVLKPDDQFADPPTENRIIGMWRESGTGYTLELRIQSRILGDKLAFAVADVDDQETGRLDALIGTANLQGDAETPGWLLTTSPAIEEILKSMDRPYARIRVVDRNQRARAVVGGLHDMREHQLVEEDFLNRLLSRLHTLMQPLLRFFISSLSADVEDSGSQPTEVDIQGIAEGFDGKSSITRYYQDGGLVEMMAAIAPVYNGKEVIAVAVVEQTTSSILSMSNRLIEETVLLSVLAFLIGGGALFVFAFVISSRIRTLRNQADASITADGRIRNAITKTGASDEIGDLGRTLDAMLKQLQEQIDYRERMADNLEHEMRTPLAGVAASLKNIEEELDGRQHQQLLEYLDGAKHNTRRLHELLTAIREGVTLKDSLSHENMEIIDFGDAITKWLDFVWKKAFPDVEFVWRQPESAAEIRGDVDRLLQALDKLIENAVSYHRPGTPIELIMDSGQAGVSLQIINLGSTIDKPIHNRIFEYMVSSRVSRDNRPHLGLGLYIARTIIEYHGGRLAGANLQDGRHGVAFTVALPVISASHR